MSNNRFFATKMGKIITVSVILLILSVLFYQFFYPVLFESYTGVVNRELSYDNSQKLSDTEFKALDENGQQGTALAQIKAKNYQQKYLNAEKSRNYYFQNSALKTEHIYNQV